MKYEMKYRISTRKDMTEEIRTKIKQKQTVCDAKSGKGKSFPLSLLVSGDDKV